MREPIESENAYLALDTGCGLFAIPICDTLGVMVVSQETPSAVLPHMPDHVKCVVTAEGQLITVITLPGDKTDAQLQGKPIVVLAHPVRMIGVVANSVKLIVIPSGGISVDRVTGAKTYTEGSDIFSILDIQNIFMDEEYGV